MRGPVPPRVGKFIPPSAATRVAAGTPGRRIAACGVPRPSSPRALPRARRCTAGTSPPPPDRRPGRRHPRAANSAPSCAGAPWPGRQSARLSALSARSLAALGFVSWVAGPRCSGFWAGRLRRNGSRDELACPTRGQTNIGGQRMTGPQRRPASLRAFPKLGPMMRWPGKPPVSAVLCSGAEWSVGAGRRGAVRSVAEWS